MRTIEEDCVRKIPLEETSDGGMMLREIPIDTRVGNDQDVCPIDMIEGMIEETEEMTAEMVEGMVEGMIEETEEMIEETEEMTDKTIEMKDLRAKGIDVDPIHIEETKLVILLT